MLPMESLQLTSSYRAYPRSTIIAMIFYVVSRKFKSVFYDATL